MYYVANISIIFDAPCLFYTNCFMFCFTSWHFYAFSGTNLLTKCHSASSCFLIFFYSRLLLKEIFSELDETKAKVPIFLTRSRSLKGKRSRATRRPHLVVARAAWPRCPPWRGPLGRPLTSPFCLYIHILEKTLNTRASIHEKFHSCRHRRP
jgi:hypothetical protein